jgi:hypothetical protein
VGCDHGVPAHETGGSLNVCPQEVYRTTGKRALFEETWRARVQRLFASHSLLRTEPPRFGSAREPDRPRNRRPRSTSRVHRGDAAGQHGCVRHGWRRSECGCPPRQRARQRSSLPIRHPKSAASAANRSRAARCGSTTAMWLSAIAFQPIKGFTLRRIPLSARPLTVEVGGAYLRALCTRQSNTSRR